VKRLGKLLLSAIAFLMVVNVVHFFLTIGGGTYREWRCAHCGATMVYWPARDRCFIFLPNSYTIASHRWSEDWPIAVTPWRWFSAVYQRACPTRLLAQGVFPVEQSTRAGLVSAYLLEPEPIASRALEAMGHDVVDKSSPSGWELISNALDLLTKSADGEKTLALKRLSELYDQAFTSLDDFRRFADIPQKSPSETK
jgi:hypothetical protein